MTLQLALEASIALVPVLVFFGALLYFDSYRLVSFREVALTLSAGAGLCVASYYANAGLASLLNIDFTQYSRYAAPFVEEGFKAIALIYLFARNRIGFMIDAAIMGFAVGTGFAVVENLYLLSVFRDASIGLWVIRGFGTAIMHGGATALFAMLVQTAIERKLKPLFLFGLAVWLVPVALHSVFNGFDSSPLGATLILIVMLPPMFLLIFSKDEQSVHTWLWTDYESHRHLLEELESGEFEETNEGRIIRNLVEKLEHDEVANVFTYIQIHTELVLRAEKMSIARETGELIVITEEDHVRFRRLHALEREIGHTILMTIRPHLHFSRRELWELNEIKGELWRVR